MPSLPDRKSRCFSRVWKTKTAWSSFPKKKADFLRVWELIKEAYEKDEPVKGLLTRKIKGGVTVDIMGVDAFLPGSQIALRRVPNSRS